MADPTGKALFRFKLIMNRHQNYHNKLRRPAPIAINWAWWQTIEKRGRVPAARHYFQIQMGRADGT